jgi:hypothetical protein
MPGVVSIPQGDWYNPDERGMRNVHFKRATMLYIRRFYGILGLLFFHVPKSIECKHML